MSDGFDTTPTQEEFDRAYKAMRDVAWSNACRETARNRVLAHMALSGFEAILNATTLEEAQASAKRWHDGITEEQRAIQAEAASNEKRLQEMRESR